MINNKVFTYHDGLVGLPSYDHLITQWRFSWEVRGWDATILSMSDALRHPLFGRYASKVMDFPSANPKGYDAACWLRWLALDVHGGGLMTDYDVINVNYPPAEERVGPTILEKCRVPCVVAAHGYAPQVIVQHIMECAHVTDGRHYSDMLWFQERSGYRAEDLCREIMHEGWESAPLIHFSRHGCRQHSGMACNKNDVVTKVTGIQ